MLQSSETSKFPLTKGAAFCLRAAAKDVTRITLLSELTRLFSIERVNLKEEYKVSNDFFSYSHLPEAFKHA